MENNVIRLLLVEDNKVDQMAFERAVKRESLPYDYTIAGSVAAGREILESTTFDLIIVDYMLGDGTSFELFDYFKEVPFIVTTGAGNEEVAVEAMKFGACDYLIKDTDGHYLKTLPTTVNLALKRKQNEKELQHYHEHLELMVEERTTALQAEIVERKIAEVAIRKSEELWDRTFNAITDIVTIQDTNLNIVRANHSALTALDLSDNEIINQHCYELFRALDEPCQGCPLLSTIKTLEPYTKEMHHEKLGKTFLVSASPILDAQGKLEYIAHVAKDITEMKQLQDQLLQAQKMEAVGLIAGGIAHNFNNNLAIILGNVELAQIKTPENNEAAPLLKNAKTAILRARDLVQQILTFSRKEEGVKVPVQPSLVVEETLELLHATIPTTVNLHQIIETNSHAITISADSSRIQEILLNLCTNAVHAMEEKGDLTISLEAVELQSQEIPAPYERMPGHYAKLSVQDNGCGMSAETIERIFEPFFTTKNINKGTGMGLSTVHGIVEQYGGLIKVKSTIGQGTTFGLYFPIIEAHQQQSISAVNDLPRGNEKILFIDDEELLANIWSQMLREYGYQVTTATSSTNALEIFKEHPEQFDLVITDQTMPHLSGKDLIKQLLNIRPDLPTALCTGYSNKIDEKEAQKLGIKAFLIKPLELAQLLQKIRQLLDEAKATPCSENRRR